MKLDFIWKDIQEILIIKVLFQDELGLDFFLYCI